MEKRRQILSKPAKVWLLIMGLTLLWGSSFIMLKHALDVYTPWQVFAGRMTFAFLTLCPFAFRELRNIPREKWLWLAIFSVAANFFTTLFYAIAQSGIESSLNGMLNALTPLMTLGIGLILFRQKMKGLQWIGLLLGFIGTLGLLWLNSEAKMGVINIFVLFAILATFFNGLTANLLKYKLDGLTVIQIASISFLLIAPFAISYAFYSGFFSMGMASPEGNEALGLVIILGVAANAIALLMMSKLIQLSSPVFASLLTYLMPLVALFWGILDGEIVTMMELGAMTIIILGIYAVNRYEFSS